MASITTAILSYNAAKDAAHEQAAAQREAQRKQQIADEQAAREAEAKKAKAIKQRDYSADGESASQMRGIQATMLASKKAMNAQAGSKTLLGE